MKSILFLAIVLCCNVTSFGQRTRKPNPYRFGAGVGYNPELNNPASVNIKYYTRRGHGLEFIGYNLQTNYRLTALFLPYFPLDRRGNLRFLIGPGIHIGWWKEGYKTNSYKTNPIIGGDGMIGFEYRIPKIPISLQGHFQPSADLAGNNEFFYGREMIGASARIVF